MTLHLVLTVADQHVRAAFAHTPDQFVATTLLDTLPSLERLRADPYRQGRSLYSALGGMAVRDQLDASDDGVLLLECDEGAATIPWEYAAVDGALLCCDYAMLRLVPRAPLPARSQPARLLVLCADPLEYQQGAAPPSYRLDFAGELAALERALHNRPLPTQRLPPTFERLITALADGPALLHISAHGTVVSLKDDAGQPYTDAALQLEDANGRSAMVLGRDLRRRAPRGSLRLVLLSACRSAPLAQALAEQGVPVALGMQHDFPDPQSAALAATFFAWLAAGNDAAEALRQARSAIAEQNPGAAGLLVAYTCRDAWGAVTLSDQPAPINLAPPGDMRVPSWFTPPSTGLLGRDAALAAVADLYSGGAPAVTINGAGGMGKTALAAAFVRRFGWRWRRVLGVSFASAPVELARVCRELLEALGQGQAAQQAQEEAEQRDRLIAQYRANLTILQQQRAQYGANVPLEIVNQISASERELAALNATDLRTVAAERLQERLLATIGTDDLVVFDNFESVLAPLAADAEQATVIRRLLPLLVAHGAKLLLTSREQPAGLPGEILFPPRSGLAGLDDEPAMQLFLQHSTRARRADGSQQHQRVAHEVARLTAGYPLAIALLAGEYDDDDANPEQFLATWPAMLARAQRPELNAHQVTFAVAFARSFQSLSEQQQARLLALRAYGVPFFAEGAALLWQLPTDGNGSPTEAALNEARHDLALFVRRNLLEVDGTFTGTAEPATYRSQPVLQQELLRRGGDDGTAQPGYGAYGVWLTNRAFGEIGNNIALAQLVRQSLAVLEAGTATLAGDAQRWHQWRLAWIRRQYGEVSQARVILEAALVDMQEATAVQSRILHELAYIYRIQGNLTRAMALYEESLAITEGLNDLQGKSAILHEIAYIHRVQGNLTRAVALYEESLAINERLGDLQGKSAILHEIAYIYRIQGNLTRAMALYEESLIITEDLGNLKGKSATLNQMAYIYIVQGNLTRAMALHVESLAIKEDLGDLQGKSATLNQMAYIYIVQGNLTRAMALHEESLAITEGLGDLQGKGAILHQMATIYIAKGDLNRAMTLYQECLAITEGLGDLQGKGATLHQMASIYTTQGNLTRAMALYEESLAITEGLNDLQGKSAILSGIANLHMQQRDWAAAQTVLETAIALALQLDDRQLIAFNTVKLGQVAQVKGDRQTALARYREGLAIHEQLSMPREMQQVRKLIAQAEQASTQPTESPIERVRR